MAKLKPIVFFLRGLNSQGDDDLRLGPINMGLYGRSFLHRFQKAQMIYVSGMGRGSAEVMAQRARDFILSHPIFKETQKPIHIFGHSLGGLVARVLAHDPLLKQRVASVVTMGTPHRGTQAALPQKNQKWVTVSLQKLMNYNFEEKVGAIVSTQPEEAQRLTEKYCDQSHIFYGSIITGRPLHQLSPIFKVIDRTYNHTREPSDGLIVETSQVWGQDLGYFDLEHLEQIGLCLYPSWSQRQRMNKELSKVILQLENCWQSL